MKMSAVVIAATLTVLSGCVSEGGLMERRGYSKEFSQGYQDGCDSGRSAAGRIDKHFTKDIKRSREDQDYREGWDAGFSTCKGQSESTGRALSH